MTDEGREEVLTIEHKITFRGLVCAIAAMLEQEQDQEINRNSVIETLRFLLKRRGESFYQANPWHHFPNEKMRIFEKASETARTLFPEVTE